MKKKGFLAANELLDMIPGIVNGGLRVDPSSLEEALSLIEYGISIGKSVDQIQRELEEAGFLRQNNCH